MTERPKDAERSDLPAQEGLFGKGAWTHEAVPPGCECPDCREWRMDSLVWIDDEEVRCDSCGTIYNPTTRKRVGSADDACLHCGELRPAMLAWSADGRVTCKTCDTVYNPGTGEVHSRGQVEMKGGGDDGHASAS